MTVTYNRFMFHVGLFQLINQYSTTNDAVSKFAILILVNQHILNQDPANKFLPYDTLFNTFDELVTATNHLHLDQNNQYYDDPLEDDIDDRDNDRLE